MKAFLRTFLATVLGVLAALALLAGATLTVLLHESPPEVADGSVLTIDLGLALSDRGRSPSAEEIVLGAATETLPLHEIRRALFAAAEDPRIVAVFVRGGVDAGAATVETLREGLQAIADRGKPALAFLDQPDEGDLYLASACDEIYLPPLGLVEFNGAALTFLYYRELLDAIGVEIQVTRVGRYKSAVEPFLLDEMSEANREQLDRLARELGAVVFGGIAAGRNLDPAELAALAARSGFLSAAEAAEAGLIDGALYFDEVLTKVAEIAGAEVDDLPQIELPDYAAAVLAEDEQAAAAADPPAGVVAVVWAEGDLVDGESDDQVGGATVARRLREARLDEDVAAVVLRVNSPGGSAFASEEILREVRLLRGVKPIVVSMGDVAASGGYWISCLADEIVARPGTITGSIGVFGMFPNAAQLLAKLGIHPQTVATGQHADLDSLLRPKTEAELALFQREVDAIYEGFLDRVVEGRGLERTAVAEIAQGRVWSGTAALELGLIDRLGGLDDAIASAAARAGLGDDWTVRFPEEPRGLVAQLLAEFEGGDPPLSRSGVAHLLDAVQETRRLASMSGVQARLPWVLVR